MNQIYCKLEITKLVEGPLQLQGHDKDVFYPYPIASGPLAELAVSWHNTTWFVESHDINIRLGLQYIF